MSDPFEEPGKLSIAKVFQDTFGVISRNIVTFAVLGVVFAGIPTLLVTFLSLDSMREQLSAVAERRFAFGPAYFQTVGMSGLAALITSSIMQGALIYATIQDLNGQKPSIGSCLATGLRNFLPLIVVNFLFVLAVVFGMVLLFVPGIMIACAWCVVGPALVADRTGIFGAFGRAAELTRGNRWRIFGLAVIIWLALLVVGAITNAISGVSTFSPETVVDRVTSPLFLTLTVIRSVITAVIGPALIAVIYVELRRARETGGPQWLADIFN